VNRHSLTYICFALVKQAIRLPTICSAGVVKRVILGKEKGQRLLFALVG
jgi:hypothetical protein